MSEPTETTRPTVEACREKLELAMASVEEVYADLKSAGGGIEDVRRAMVSVIRAHEKLGLARDRLDQSIASREFADPRAAKTVKLPKPSLPGMGAKR